MRGGCGRDAIEPCPVYQCVMSVARKVPTRPLPSLESPSLLDWIGGNEGIKLGNGDSFGNST